MSLIKTTKKHIQNKPIIIVGKTDTEKKTKALEFVSENHIFFYANEIEELDNFSLDDTLGLVIDEVNYKPKTDIIRKAMLEYRGQTVLLSDNQKDVPKSIMSLCTLKRCTKRTMAEDIQSIAPRSQEPRNYDIDTFSMVREYLKNADREEVSQMLLLTKPPDVQILSWLVPNLHPNKLAFVDYSVKRRWNATYFYELLAYAHEGRLHRKMQMPTRKSYSIKPKIAKRIGFPPHLFDDLIQDEQFRKYVQSRVDNTENRLLKLGEKKRKRKTDPIIPIQTLEKWMN
jgi:hypothetical protein|tara:strand:+ start:261 stop:1115 length:855 start_codon:yes stop_codon:yes gene_type:complete